MKTHRKDVLESDVKVTLLIFCLFLEKFYCVYIIVYVVMVI